MAKGGPSPLTPEQRETLRRENAKWEKVIGGESPLYRTVVPGGWLYRAMAGDGLMDKTVALCFVPQTKEQGET